MNYADQDYCIGRGLGAFKAKCGVSNTVFLKHAVELNAAYLHRRSQGSTFAAVSTDDVKTVPIPVFTTEQQERIAILLTSIDTAIETTEALIAKYQQIKAGLMYDLFTCGVLPTGKLRPPREQAPELYQETALGWMPRGWQVMKLGEACKVIVDCPHSTPTFLPSGDLVARTMHIKNGAFLENEASRVSEVEYLQRISRAEPMPGDVVFTREAPVGEAFVVPTGMRICLGQRVMLIRPDSGMLDSNYLVAQIYAGTISTRIKELTAGTTNPHLNVADVRDLCIALPSRDEQQKMKLRIIAINVWLRSQDEKLFKLRQQKSGLMHDLLTGKVPVKVEEPELVDG
jgi:type I restriction enzyme S subunit